MVSIPTESVEVMRRVIRYTQSHALHKPTLIDMEIPDNKSRAISEAVIDLAENVHATAIVAETKSGTTAPSCRRPSSRYAGSSCDFCRAGI